ncbi:hypothetical protein FQZ97_1105250 [compost metagenome]
MGAAGDVGGFVDLDQYPSRFFKEQPSGLAQFDPTIGTLEQPRANLLLQRLDLLAQGRLGDAQGQRGTAEMQFFGDGDEVTQVTQFHGAIQ